jgi:hypothetical protein
MFVDYVFTLLPDGSILFDKELGIDKINAKSGDRFVAKELPGGQVCFKKLDGIELFLEEAKTDMPNVIKGYN